MENSAAFASLAAFQFPTPSRLLSSACCPDKDLVVIVTRPGGKNKMSLWKMQGSKKWDIDIDSNGHANNEVVSLTWSPDCQSIALAHDPPRVTVHSVQDGREERVLLIKQNLRRPSLRLTSLAWFQAEKLPPALDTIPDILKRKDDIPGSAHSMFKALPLLDPIQDDSQPLTATDLFAFQGGSKRSIQNTKFPDVIANWPSLPPDPVAASIKAPSVGMNHGEELDERDDRNDDSILCACDDMGNVHCFLDGSFPLGTFPFNTNNATASLFKDAKKPIFYTHIRSSSSSGTDLAPMIVKVPLLEQRIVRDVARTCSAAKELTWYVMRSIKEMRTAWCGSEYQNGAKEVGHKWIVTLETKQRDQFGQREPNALLDLTCLLLTGRASDALSDFLGSGEQMSERGIHKWENTLTESLLKLRDYAEKKVVPACQRLHLLVEEVQGWVQLPAFAFCEFSASEAKGCLQAIGRMILLASWLASAARQELARFKEFVGWLRYEITKNAQTDPHNHLPPRFDILQVNEYIMSGLVDGQIDKWFLGPTPKFSTEDIGISGPNVNVAEVLERSRQFVQDPTKIAWRHDIKRKDLSSIDRNIDALIQEVSSRSSRLFSRLSNATCSSASVSYEYGPHRTPAKMVAANTSELQILVCERYIREKDSGVLQNLAIRTVSSAERTCVLLARIHYGPEAHTHPLRISIALLDCGGAEGDITGIEVVNAEFFDDETLLVVYRRQDQACTNVGTVTCAEIGYQELPLDGEYVNGLTRERVMMDAMERWRKGELTSIPMPIKQSRTLVGCKEGEVNLAVNGRAGRRVACVLDAEGIGLEILDMEGEESG